MICYGSEKLTNKKTVTSAIRSIMQEAKKHTLKFPFMVGVNVNEINLLHVNKVYSFKGYTQGNRIEIDMKERTIKLNGRNELKNFDMVEQ